MCVRVRLLRSGRRISDSDTHDEVAQACESAAIEWLRHDVCLLICRGDPLNVNSVSCDLFAEKVMLDVDVLASATGVALIDCHADSSLVVDEESGGLILLLIEIREKISKPDDVSCSF